MNEEQLLRAKAVELAISTYCELDEWLEWERHPDDDVAFLLRVSEQIYNFLKGNAISKKDSE
jgi:hypothetical protein